MNVLFLLSSLEAAGSETYCVSLAKAWKGRHDVFWISDRLHFGQRYLSLPISAKAFPGGITNTLKVARFIRENKISLVHSHSRRAHWVAAQAAAVTRIPHVTTVHQPPPVHFFSRLFPCLGDVTIAIDEVVVDHVRTYFRRRAESIRLIRNGIEIPPKPPPAPGRRPKRVAVLGRLSGGRWRAVQFFIDVLKRLAKTLPPAQYLLAGRVPDGREGELTAQLRGINLSISPSCMELSGWTDKLPEFIASCDGIIAAGRSGLESLALERPLIMMGEGGVIGLAGPDTWSEALRTNLGDHIAPKQFYPANLEAALRKLLSDAPMADRARWGRSQVATYYDIRSVADAVAQVYEDLVPPAPDTEGMIPA